MPFVRTRASGATRKALDKFAGALDEHERLLMLGGKVPELTKVLCAAMVAGLNACTPALVAHRKRARELGADAQMLTEIWDNAQSEHYSQAQRSALAAAVALTREPRAIPPAVMQALRQHYSDEEVFELVCVIGFENYRNRVDNALRLRG